MRPHRVAGSVGALLLVWAGLSVVEPSMFPSPVTVFGTAYEFSVEGDVRGRSALWHLGLTLSRVLAATTAAMTLSVVLAVLMWTSPAVESVVSFWLPVWMTPPDIIVILITMILLGFNATAVVVAVAFVYTPFGLVTVWEGMQDVDAGLVEMAEAFEASGGLVWRRIYLPHLTSYVFSATRTVFGMTWKVAVIAEVLGIDAGVGAQIRFWYTQGEIAMVLAYTVLFVVVVLALEYGALQPLQDRTLSWRQEQPG